jgi:hypothetical protein
VEFAETTMKLRYKILLGVGSVVAASAPSFPNDLGILGPTTWRQREALTMCQQVNSTFIRYLASDRDNCFSRLRTVSGERTGLWSRHDRNQRQMARNDRETAPPAPSPVSSVRITGHPTPRG